MNITSAHGALGRGFGLVALVAAATAQSALAQANPQWLGRPFVKIVAQGDPIPGTPGATFGFIEHLTLRDGTIHFVAGENLNKKGLFRWRDGVVTKLVYTDTLAPNGKPFDTVDSTTDETEGALNFGAMDGAGQPDALAGLFEWRNGVITTIFDGQRAVDGKLLHGGLGYAVRVGHQLAGSALFTENGVEKNGIFRWDGTTLRTVVQTGDDLPGSLGGFLGTPRGHQIAFDGQSVGFVAAAGSPGVGPVGMYRAGPDGVLTKLVDGNDGRIGGKTFFQANRPFINLDLNGTNSFAGVTGRVAATGKGDSFYYQYPGSPGEIIRCSGGTFDFPNGSFGDNNLVEFVLLASDVNQGTPTQLDGQLWRAQTMDGHGDDVAALVSLRTASGFNKPAIYAAVGGTTQPPAAPILAAPTLADGSVTLRFASLAGKTYRVEFRAALGDPAWTARGDLAGTGAELTFSETAASAGFYRVTLLP
jgi:hypothetical protein